MKKTFLILFLLSFLVITNVIKADRKYFGRSYTANTLSARSLEIELWNTVYLGKSDGTYYKLKPVIEIEYGLTDNLTAAFLFGVNHERIKTNNLSSSKTEFDGVAVELRYLFGEIDKYFVDPGIYVEAGYSEEETSVESKIILSKRYNNFVSVFNFITEIEHASATGINVSSSEITGGISYDLTTTFAIGAEVSLQSNYLRIFKKNENSAVYIGPTLSYLRENFDFCLNVLAQVSGSPKTWNNLELQGNDKYQIRTIIGIDL